MTRLRKEERTLKHWFGCGRVGLRLLYPSRALLLRKRIQIVTARRTTFFRPAGINTPARAETLHRRRFFPRPEHRVAGRLRERLAPQPGVPAQPRPVRRL